MAHGIHGVKPGWHTTVSMLSNQLILDKTFPDEANGNMDYGEFEGGTKNQKSFVRNITIFQEKIHTLKNG